MQEAAIIKGGSHTDTRGTLSFVNDFDMTAVKRFYVIEHPDTNVVRAWQAHKAEQKWFYVVAGSFEVVTVKVDDWDNPSADLPVTVFELSAAASQVLHVPGGHANGFKALTPDAKVIVFSDIAMADAGKDDFRFDAQLWYNWNKI